jgi:hypothetical protein
MTPFSWHHAVNERLELERQPSFADITLAMDDGGLLDIIRHRNAARSPQRQMLVDPGAP